ncbi:hypothetical protein U8V72_21325 [Priestia filamentosa]|uniref:hypothetical protein n=1 Tax=Priestia filamentosa TaxID=1402861 RepID=UPI00397B2697
MKFIQREKHSKSILNEVEKLKIMIKEKEGMIKKQQEELNYIKSTSRCFSDESQDIEVEHYRQERLIKKYKRALETIEKRHQNDLTGKIARRALSLR